MKVLGFIGLFLGLILVLGAFEHEELDLLIGLAGVMTSIGGLLGILSANITDDLGR